MLQLIVDFQTPFMLFSVRLNSLDLVCSFTKWQLGLAVNTFCFLSHFVSICCLWSNKSKAECFRPRWRSLHISLKKYYPHFETRCWQHNAVGMLFINPEKTSQPGKQKKKKRKKSLLTQEHATRFMLLHLNKSFQHALDSLWLCNLTLSSQKILRLLVTLGQNMKKLKGLHTFSKILYFYENCCQDLLIKHCMQLSSI